MRMQLIFLFSLLYCNELIYEKEYEYYLTEEEKINLPGLQVAITSNNSNPNLTEYYQMNQQKLISQASGFQIDFHYSEVFLVEKYNQNFIDLCFFMNNIQCKYRIHNYLLDDKLIVDQLNLSFYTNFTKCFELINYKEELYILICQEDLRTIAQIINEKSIVLDQISFSSVYPVSFSFLQEKILFYEVDSLNSTVKIYEILSKNQFTMDPLIVHISEPKLGKVKRIKFQQESYIIITFEYKQIKKNYLDPEQNSLIYMMMTSDFIYLNENSDLVFGISKKNQTEISLYNGVFRLGSQFKIPIDVIQMNNILLVYEDEIIILVNKITNFTLKSQHKFVKKLVTYHSYYQSIKIQRLTFTKYIVFPNTFPKKIVILPLFINIFIQINKKVHLHNPSIIVKLQELKTLKMMDKQNLMLSSKFLSSGMPIDFKECYTNQQKITILQNIHKTNFTYQQGIIKLVPVNQFIFAITKLNSKITLQKFSLKDYLHDTPKILEIPDIDNIYINQFNILYVVGRHFYHYSLENEELNLVNEQHFSCEILQIKSHFSKMLLLFENCTIIEYHLNTKQFYPVYKLAFLKQLFFSNLIQEQYLGHTLINFTINTIKLKFKNNLQKILTFSQILDCDIIGQRLIVYELHQNQIKTIIYSYQLYDILKNYDLPIYNYTIFQPLFKQVSDTYLAISAIKENQQVILIYQISNPSSSSLRKVINIDNYSYFSFLEMEETWIYYVQDNQVHFENIDKLETNLKMDVNKFYEIFEIKCVLQSQISNFLSKIVFEITVINQIFRIRLENYEYISSNSIIKLDNVKGIINDLELIDQMEDFFILKPFATIISKQFECTQITNLYCLNQFSLIIDYYGKNLTLTVNNSKFIFIYPLSDSNYTNLFINDENDLLISYLSPGIENNESWKFTEAKLILKNIDFQMITKKVQNLFVVDLNDYPQAKKNLKMFFLLKNLKIQFIPFSKTIHTADIFYFQNYFLIAIALDSDFKIFVIRDYDDDQNIENIKEFTISNRSEFEDYQFAMIDDIRIINLVIEDQLLLIQVFIFEQINQGYVYELKINVLDWTINHKRKQVIRYGQDRQLTKVLYSDSKLVILSLKGFFNHSLRFYKIQQNSEIIDSYFQLMRDDIISLEKHNETYFSMISSQVKGIYQLSLVQVGDYQLLIQNEDQTVKNLSIRIKSDVEDFLTFLIIEEKKILQKHLFLNYLLLVNMAVIIGFIILRKQTQKERKFDVVQ